MTTFNARFGAWALLLSVFGLPFAPVLPAQSTFTNVTATVVPGLRDPHNPCVAWGDYDNDGRLDFLFVAPGTFQLYHNTGNSFEDVAASLVPGVLEADWVAWGDYDNDGRLDFLLSTLFGGPETGWQPANQIWRNTGNGFTNVTATVAPGLSAGWQSASRRGAWADFDNDGRLDFVVTGHANSQLWRNTGSGFTNVTATVAPGLPKPIEGWVAWGDYDNDGRPDLFISGTTKYQAVPNTDDEYISESVDQIWRNTEGGFVNVTTNIAPGLPVGVGAFLEWADFDNDGWIDFFFLPGSGPQLWRNMGGTFTNVTASVVPGLPNAWSASVAWADFDNDGRLDFLLTGATYTGLVSQLWRNTGAGFTNVTASEVPSLPPVVSVGTPVTWADYDNDGRPDFLIAGQVELGCDGCDEPDRISQLWRNNAAQTNPPPAIITGLPGAVNQNSVTLNARIDPRGHAASAWFVWGDSTNYGQVTAAQPMGNGNSFTNFFQSITGLSVGVTYYYRAVGSNDQGLVFLGFEQRFTLAAPGVTTGSGESFSPTTATLNAQANPNNLPAYGWFEWGLTPTYGQVTPVRFLGSGFSSSFGENIFGLEGNTAYYFRAVASNILGVVHGAARSLITPVTDVCPGASLSPSSKSLGYIGGRGYSFHAVLSCPWIVINTNSWITITSPTSGTALDSTVIFDVAANTDPQPRSGNITIGGHNFLLNQAGGNGGVSCYIFMSPGSSDRGYGAMMGTVNVSAATNCAWEVVNTNSWITILSGGGIGNGQVVYELEGNPGMQSRSGSFTIGNRIHTIRQAGHSQVSLPADQVVALGGTATFSVTVSNITPPFTYQWQFNGVDLVDGGGISGASTANLTLTDIQYSQAGHYRCVVSNAFGYPYFSSSATLTVAPTSNALPIAEALDTDDMFFWKTWSDSSGIWFGQTNTTHDGVDALECSGLSQGEFASLEAKSGGPGILSFWWKTALATTSDRLQFWIGSWQAATVTNTTDWEQRTFTVPPGDVNLRWTLATPSTGEQSKVWLDQVQFTPCDFRLPGAGSFVPTATGGTITVTAAADCPWHVVNTNSWITILSSVTNHGSGLVIYAVAPNPTPANRVGYLTIADQSYFLVQGGNSPNPAISLPEALDTEGSLDWSTIGSPEWFGQNILSRDGADAAQSGPVGDSAAVTATTTVNGPGTLLFWWRVSSETNKDYLKFFIDGVQQTRISGEVDWQLLSYNLFSGSNVLKWTYSKNASVAVGQDRGWLDQVQFVPTPETGVCGIAISPISATHSGNSETGSVSVVAAAGCGWDVVNPNSWITYVASLGESNGLVRYTVSPNNSRSPRTGVLLIGGRPFTVTQASGLPPCSYYVSATNVSLSPQPWSSVVTVLTQPGCEWSVFNTNSWITINAYPTNSGSGHFVCSVSQNTVPVARTGQVRIEGHILTIYQSAAPPPPAIPFAEALETVGTPLVWSTTFYPWVGTTSVTHDGVDAAVAAADAVSSSLITSVTGPGTLTFWWKVSGTNSRLHLFVSFSEQAHISDDVDWEQRTMTIPVGTHFLEWYFVRGSAGYGWLDQVQFVPTPLCPVTLLPGTNAHPAGFSTGLVNVAAAPDCAWGVFNPNSWITITSGSSGTGNGSVTYIVAANPIPLSRSGSIFIGDQSYSITQAGADQSNCTFAISVTNRMHGYGPGSNVVAVTTTAGCNWFVINTNNWITITSGTNRSGTGIFGYALAANPTTATRSGNIRIANQLFVVTQSGASYGTNAPRLQLMSRTGTNATLSVQGEEGKMYVVESSEDLIHWTPISTNSAPSTITDGAGGSAPRRFYRTVEIP